MVHLGWSSCLFGKYITDSCPGTWAWCVFRVRCGALNAAFGKLGNFCLFMGLMPPLAVPVFKPTPSSAPKTSSGSNGPIDRKPRAPRRPRAIFASWNAEAPQGQITGKSHVLDPMFGAQARLPGECQADGAFPCGQSVCIARPSSAGAWLERPRLSWAGAQKCEKNNPKSASAPYTRPTTTPDDPTDAFQVVSGTNWDPKARVLRGHAPSFAMPRPGPTSEVSTVKSAPARPIFVPLLCQQPLLRPRTEAISGSNWSQLTLKWPQFLGGRTAKKQSHDRIDLRTGP